MKTLLLTVALLLVPTPALASSAHWSMNENRGTVLHDATGHGFTGTIGRKVRLTGKAHRFTFTANATSVPGRIDTVPDYDRLDPGSKPFSVRVRFQWQGAHDRNLIQKGQGSPDGGLFKMKTSVPAEGQPKGQLKCLFRGSTGDSQVESYGHSRLDDGKWHVVECTRTPTGTVMAIDGVVVDRNGNDPGVISNDWPIAIGGNSACDAEGLICNYWYGQISDIQWKVRH
jgi:hypothetical protein